MQPYPAPIEVQMQRYYQSLCEKDRPIAVPCGAKLVALMGAL
ncbi:MAG: hypothetical protein SFW36_15330 [Leptolyngbyaceae cyanobacterium bins.59]|nr:hypothetical protein [Leptolyngbyaceae cyanobacterium bins.59]